MPWIHIALLATLLAAWVGPARAETLVVSDTRPSDGGVSVETSDWRLVWNAFFNGGIHQWFDLAHDPTGSDNLTTESSGGNYNTGTLFDYDVYLGFGFNQINEFMTTVGRNASTGALTFEILENTPARLRIEQTGHPRLNNGTGPPGDPFVELAFVDVTTIWTVYPTGKVGIEFHATRNPDAEIVDSGPGGAGKGVRRLNPPFENRVSATGGTNFLTAFATAGDTIESPGGGWGPLHIVQRVSENQLILEEDIPAGTFDFVIRRNEVRLETISIHADGDPSIVNQCSDPATSRWEGGSDGNPLWSTPLNDGCGSLLSGSSQDVLLAHWARDRPAGSLLSFYEPWLEQTSGFYNDVGFTDISYTQTGRVGLAPFQDHHRHFLAQMGSSSPSSLPTIRSVAEAEPYSLDYRTPFAEALEGTLATGPQIGAFGFNPGTAAYEIEAIDNRATIRFDASGGTRSAIGYPQVAIELSNFFASDADVAVERSTDGGATFTTLNPAGYNLSTQADEAEIGSGRRVFQILNRIPAVASGADAWAYRFSAPPLPPSCASSPATDCIGAAKASLVSNEKSEGKEKLSLDLKGLDAWVELSDLGNPLSGTTLYRACVYDESDELVAAFTVDRAGEACGSGGKPCWKSAGGGWKYADPDGAAHGVRKIVARGGPPGRGRVTVKAKNNAAKGQAALPTGIAAALGESETSKVRVHVSDGACFGATLATKNATGEAFKAKTP